METNQNSKKMEKTKTIFVNNGAIAYELAALNTTLIEAKKVKKYLEDSDVLVTPETILQACRNQFNSIVAASKEPELQAMQAFNDKVGSNEILNEMTLQRINEKGEKLNQKLLAGLPKMGINAKHYLQFISMGTMEIVPGVREVLTEKHSLKADAEMVTHHESIVNGLNYFLEKYPNQPIKVILERLYRVDEFNRKAELKLDNYDPQNICRDWIGLRANNML